MSDVTTPVFDQYNTGALPPGGPARNLSVISAYAEAGIKIQAAGGGDVIAIDEAELVNVKNCTVAGAGGAKTKVRGIEMRILGAPAFYEYLPTPVTITRLGWTVRAGASTMNDPKYAMVAPET